MTTAKNKTEIKEDGTLVITRFFNAPVERVWKAWSTEEGMKKWWGPKRFTCPSLKMDFRVGGTLFGCMRSPEGKDYYNIGVCKELVPFKKLVYTDNFADEKGNVVPAEYYGMSGFDQLSTITVTFETVGNQTKMTLTHTGCPKGKICEMTGVSWNESFEKLEESLK